MVTLTNILCIVGHTLTSFDFKNLNREHRRHLQRALRKQPAFVQSLPRESGTEQRASQETSVTPPVDEHVDFEVPPISAIRASSIPLDPTTRIVERLYQRFCETVQADQIGMFVQDLTQFSIPWGCLCQLREDLGEAFFFSLVENFPEAFSEDYRGVRLTEMGAQAWKEAREQLLAQFQSLDCPVTEVA